MEIEAPIQASSQANISSSESLQQRQRDKFISQGRDSKVPRLATNVNDVHHGLEAPVTLSPSLKGKTSGNFPPDSKRIKPHGRRDEQSASRKDKGSLGDIKVNITPEAISGGREGRQFAVSHVGNNGRIYLR